MVKSPQRRCGSIGRLHQEIPMKLSNFLAAFAAFAMLPMTALAQDAIKTEIAPGAKLRVALIGVRVLGGVGEPVGKFLAERLGLPFQAVTYPNPQAYEAS